MIFMLHYNLQFQADARRSKVKEARKRREDRQAQKKQEMLAVRNLRDFRSWENIKDEIPIGGNKYFDRKTNQEIYKMYC